MTPATRETKVFLFHPTAIIIMFILDWGGFVLEVPQVLSPITLIITFISLFAVASTATYYLQTHFGGEDKKTARLKAALAGLICAMPAPLMTGVVGTIVLALSGFDAIKKQGVGGLIEMFRTVKST